jgi:hypothetical protein
MRMLLIKINILPIIATILSVCSGFLIFANYFFLGWLALVVAMLLVPLWCKIYLDMDWI